MPSEKGRSRGPYAGGVARKEAILDATVDMIAEVGYRGLSMRDVARRVGISHPGVIYHFPSKAALLMAVIQRYEGSVHFSVEQMAQMRPFDVFCSFLDLSRELAQNPTIAEMECTLVVEASTAEHPAHDHFALRFEELQGALTGAFSGLAKQGWLASPAKPRDLGLALLAQWYGLQIQWLYNPETVDVTGVLTRAIVGYLDLSQDEAIEAALASSFASPAAIQAIETASGYSLAQMLERGYSVLNTAHMGRYGLQEVPQDILDTVIRSGVVTGTDLYYMEENKRFSIDLLGRLVINHVLKPEQYNVLSDLGVVPAEAVAALTSVMEASAVKNHEA